jgi:hypothetical protein
MKFLAWVGATFIAVLFVVGFGFLLAFPVKWLINYVFTDGVRLALFGMAKIDFWHAYCLNLACGFLFKSTSASTK